MNDYDHILGPVTPGRECGDCVTCCKLPSIDTAEFTKPRHVMCPHNTGAGCGIYDQRPTVCRTFFCGWRRAPWMPDAARPDRSGVMFMVSADDPPANVLRKVYIRGMAASSWDDFNHPQAVHALKQFITGMIPVWLHYDGVIRLFHPSDAIAAVVINKDPPSSPEVAAQAARWTQLYG